MSLDPVFGKAANLGVVAKRWLANIESRFGEAGIEMPVKTGVDGAASLIAPAALLAQLIHRERLPADRPLRVLLISDEPVSSMDEGIWLSYAAEFAGVQEIQAYSTFQEAIHSSLYDAGKALGLKPYQRITPLDAQAMEFDLALWVHPAIEAGQSAALVELVAGLHRKGCPVYGAMYNELDALIQTHGLAHEGLEFSWMDGPVATGQMSKASLNKFGIATADLGIEGGWGAVLTKVQPATVSPTTEDWAMICAAMALYKLEGSDAGSWSFGSKIAGVSFNKSVPIALIGNLAVDPATGLILSECATTKVLNSIGQLWLPMLAAMPVSKFELLPWAARVKLAFNAYLTKEEKKRKECIDMLTRFFAEGMDEAGLALARGYESIGTKAMKAEARALYQAMGDRHPMSAYYLAFEAYEAGKEAEFFALMQASASAGYVPAMADLGKVMIQAGRVGEGIRLLEAAMQRGDAEAAFCLGEKHIQAQQYSLALETLRRAWTLNHQDALNTAHFLCNEMLKHHLGDAGSLKRELKDIKFAISKRVRYENQAKRDNA